jgi:hypothetical protein
MKGALSAEEQDEFQESGVDLCETQLSTNVDRIAMQHDENNNEAYDEVLKQYLPRQW